MAKVSPEVLAIVREALERYIAEVENSYLSPAAKKTYSAHSEEFVRWLNDDFEPGGSVRARR